MLIELLERIDEDFQDMFKPHPKDVSRERVLSPLKHTHFEGLIPALTQIENTMRVKVIRVSVHNLVCFVDFAHRIDYRKEIDKVIEDYGYFVKYTGMESIRRTDSGEFDTRLQLSAAKTSP